MLLATVTLWGLNFTVTKYVLSHGFQPLAYGCLRFAAASAILGGIAAGRERTLTVRRRDLVFLGVAALIGICLNQVTFVYATKLTTATAVALMFGTLPVMAGLFAFAFGIERLGARLPEFAGDFLGGPVVPQVADRYACGPELGEAERDRPADPARASGHEDRGALEAHRAGGSGASAGAELGISPQPDRSRGTRGPSSAFEDAWPSRSSSSICSSA